jgi:hypothetical protein
MMFAPENIAYSPSHALSKKACLDTKIKNTIQITYFSTFRLWILKMSTETSKQGLGAVVHVQRNRRSQNEKDVGCSNWLCSVQSVYFDRESPVGGQTPPYSKNLLLRIIIFL